MNNILSSISITITITNQLNEQDWLAINRTVINQSNNSKKHRNLLLMVFTVFILVTAWSSYTWIEYYQTYKYYISIHSSLLSHFLQHMFWPIILLVSMIILVVQRKKYPRYATRIILRNPENKTFLSPATITFSDEGLYTEKEYIRGYYQWTSFVKVIDTFEFLMLFVSASQGLFIKKSDCSENELQVIRDLLHKHYEGKIITLTHSQQ